MDENFISSGQVNAQGGQVSGGQYGSTSGFYGTNQAGGSHFGTSQSSSSGSSGQFSTTFVNGGQVSGGQSGSSHAAGGQVSGGQYGTHVSGGQFSGGQVSGGQYGHGQVSGTQYGSGQVSEGQYGSGQIGGPSGTYFYNRTWSSGSTGEGLTAEEREAIRKNLEAAAKQGGRGFTQSQGGQSGYTQSGQAQGVYGQGNYYQGQDHAQGSQGYGGQTVYGLGGFDNVGQDGRIVRVKNKTIIYDANHNIISQTETSTEYGSLGQGGEAGSSFNA